MYGEDDLIPVSALQHTLFCARQYALIHLEQDWTENRFTAEGRALHERVDVEHHESRRLFRQEYGMAVRSLQWGLIGKCDLVELWFSDGGGIVQVLPVEFKRGRKKQSDVDRVQLCAQVFCLEEMFNITIDMGQLYYLQEHRRTGVTIDNELREKTCQVTERTRTIWDSGITPAAEYSKQKCDRCSLVDSCMPKTFGKKHKDVEKYVKLQLQLTKNNCALNAGVS
ncbi:CRISPR-associated protein Cas4 [Spirochaetia bacterium]|nr:CRISPR-associated protein Cas4 [Spirochaetia bacterium]